MTFHPRSVVEFGLFFNNVFESLLAGAPISRSAELIGEHLSADAVAIRIDGPHHHEHGVLVIWESACVCATGEAPLDAVDAQPATQARLTELLETSYQATATTLSEEDGTRYTLWVFRDLGDQGFDAEEASVCEILVSQLRRGMELSAKMGNTEIERTLYSNVMDRLSVGVVILDLNGRIVNRSKAACDTMADHDGLRAQGGRLRASYAAEDRKLQQTIKEVIRSVADGETMVTRGLSLSRPSGERSLGIIVQPIQGDIREGQSVAPSVAVYVRDPEAAAEVEGELLSQLFDLTPAEAAVVSRLTTGLSLGDAASSLDISRNTARAHLRSIFSKSGITRQSELIRLMLNSAVVLGERPHQIA